jgi:hypothetical protein
MTSHYRCPLTECDVLDRVNLTAFRSKRLEWRTLLEDDPEHSVWRQLSALLWEDCAFRFLNELRRLTPLEPRSPTNSSLVAEAIDNNYVQTMILGVSRLTDPQSSDPRKGVVSLRRLSKDVQDHRHLITREAFICFDGMKFDPSTIPLPWEHGQEPGTATWRGIGGPMDRDTPLRIHDQFDQLSGTDPTQRTRFDRIKDGVFTEINALLSSPAIERIRFLRNKFIAHASDALSRQGGQSPALSLSMANVEDALRPLMRSYHRLGSEVLCGMGTGEAVMPAAQFDPLEGLVESFTAEDQDHLRTFWDEQVEMHNRWHEPLEGVS